MDAAVLDDAVLDAAVRIAIRPRTLRERVRLRISGGWTARQVYERLDDGTRITLLTASERPPGERPGDAGQDGQRTAVDRVYRRLLGLAEGGELQRKKVQYTMTLNTKGPRDMLVDVFR